MTDIPIPPVSPASSATPARGLLDAPRDGTLQSVPKSLLGGDRAVKLRGEVQGRNQDGSTRINTPRGPVNVRIEGDQLPRGTRVEVEIPPGNPPASARVRAEAPPQPQQQAQQTSQQAQAPQTQTPPPRPDAPPQPQATPRAAPPPAQGQPPAQTQSTAPAPQPAPQSSQPGQSPPPQTTTTPAGLPQGNPSPSAQTALPLPQGPVTGAPVGGQISPANTGLPLPGTAQPAPAGQTVLSGAPLQTGGAVGAGQTVTGYTPASGGLLQGNGVGTGGPTVLQVGQFVHLTPASMPMLGATGLGAGGGTGIPMPASTTVSATLPAGITAQGGASLTGSGIANPSLLSTSISGGAGGLQTAPATGAGVGLTAATPSMSTAASGLLPSATAGSGAGGMSAPFSAVLAPSSGAPASSILAGASLSGALPSVGPSASTGLQTAPQSAVTPPSIRIAGQNITVDAKILGIASPQTGTGQTAAAGIFAPTNTQPGQVTGVIGPMITPPGGGAPRMSLSLFDGGRMMAGPLLLPSGIAPMAQGTSLQLDIVQTQAVGPQGRAAGVPLPGLQGLYQSLTLADGGLVDIAEFLDTLAARLPAADAQSAMRVMPQIGGGNVGARFTTPVLFFLAALRGGDIGAWMGERNANLLRDDGKTDLLARLTRGFSALSKSFSEPVQVQGGEWRSASLPLLFGPDLTRLQFHIRDYHGREEQDDDMLARPSRRVVIDFSLSRMGDMQLDSLLFEGRMDTMLRTEHPFSDRMRQDLRQRYTSVMRGIGYQGALDFQSAHG